MAYRPPKTRICYETHRANCYCPDLSESFGKAMAAVSTPEKHRRRIEKQSARMPKAMLDVMGGGGQWRACGRSRATGQIECFESNDSGYVMDKARSLMQSGDFVDVRAEKRVGGKWVRV